MFKKSLIAIVVLAVAIPALAGDVKVHDPWPMTYVEVPVCTIDVIMDVGYYIHIKDQKPIKVSQSSIGGGNPYFTYYGCKRTDVISNFAAELSTSVAATSAAGGSWSATLDGQDTLVVPAGTTSVEICVTGKKVAIEKLTASGGKKNVKVAEVTISVMPGSYTPPAGGSNPSA